MSVPKYVQDMENVLKAIKESPGTNHKRLSELLGRNYTAIQRAVNRLKIEGKIYHKRLPIQGQHFALYPNQTTSNQP